MLSRVANALLWLARYIERAENAARFVDVNLQLQLERPGAHDVQWQAIVSVVGAEEAFAEQHQVPTQDAVLRFLTSDRSFVSSIASCLDAARENARTVREVISREYWQQINEFHLWLRERASRPPAEEDLYGFYAEIRQRALLCEGVADATMSRTEGWHWLRLGRSLERADMTSRILDVKYFLILPTPGDVGGAIDQAQWSALLNSASAMQMFRQRHHRTTAESVIGFLVLDPYFPRSIRHCIASAEQSLRAITHQPPGSYATEAERRLGMLRARVDYERAEAIIAEGLHEWVDRLQADLAAVGAAVDAEFFAG